MYIVFEGNDGCGKTTNSTILSAILKQINPLQNIIMTREPESHLIDLKIRDFVLSDKKISKESLEFLFLADRMEHFSKIKEKLNNGDTVISDRSFISGYAYCKANQNLDPVLTELIHEKIAQQHERPHHVFIGMGSKLYEREISELTREEIKGEEHQKLVLEYMVEFVERLELPYTTFDINRENKKDIANKILNQLIIDPIEITKIDSESERVDIVIKLKERIKNININIQK